MLASLPKGSEWSFSNVQKDIEIPFVWLTKKKTVKSSFKGVLFKKSTPRAITCLDRTVPFRARYKKTL